MLKEQIEMFASHLKGKWLDLAVPELTEMRSCWIDGLMGGGIDQIFIEHRVLYFMICNHEMIWLGDLNSFSLISIYLEESYFRVSLPEGRCFPDTLWTGAEV